MITSINGLIQFLEPSLLRASRHPSCLLFKKELIKKIADIWARIHTTIAYAYTYVKDCFLEKEKAHIIPLPKIPKEILLGHILNVLELSALAGMLPFMNIREKTHLLQLRPVFVSKLLSYYELDMETIPASWKEALAIAGPSIEELDLQSQTIDPKVARSLTQLFPNLKRLNARNCKLSDGALFYLKNLNLNTLFLKESQGITELGLHVLAGCKTIEHLELPQIDICTLPEFCFHNALEGTPIKIQKLYLYTSQYFFHFFLQNIQQEGTHVFHDFVEKTRARRADITINALKKIENLRHLVLPDTWFGFSETHLQTLTRLKKIRHLDLECYSWQTRNSLFTHLATLPELEECTLASKHISGVEATAFKDHKNLTKLTLKNAEITKLGILAITQIPSLKKLDLEHSLFFETLTEQEYHALGKMPHLESLACPISDIALFATHLRDKFSHLKTLIIRPSTNVQDKDIEALCTLPSLTHLHIQTNCGLLTRRALSTLATSKTLRSVSLHGALFTKEVMKDFPSYITTYTS